MHVILLGTAAGGGFPQWNCWCPTCRLARSDPARAHPRTQSSVAVSADGERWWLLNASPDVRTQLQRLPPARQEKGVRHVPIEGILLTDAELDHTLGIPLLREARRLSVYCTEGAERILERDSGLLPLTSAFAAIDVIPLVPATRTTLRHHDGTPSSLDVLPFRVPGDPPRFAQGDPPAHTVGLLVRDAATGGSLAYVPGSGALDAVLLATLGGADLVLFDGTFWRDDELQALGIGSESARRMGHLPISGEDGSLARLGSLPSRRRVYTHINNTNPVLLEDSPERRAVLAAGCEVGADGMTFSL